MEPLIFALGSLLLLPSFNNHTREPRLAAVLLGLLSLALFFWDGARIWSWRLELLPESLRVRRYYRWTAIPWEQISKVESCAAKFGRRQQSVILTLESGASEELGTFLDAFAISLRDRLRLELDKRCP